MVGGHLAGKDLSSQDSDAPGLSRTELGILIGLALLKLLIHLYTNAFAGYGMFRDELYYIAGTEHLGAGYVDHPPLSVWVLALVRWILGDSLFALRLLPALFGAAAVFLTGLIARELGGRCFAVLVAALAALVSIIALAYDSVYSMNALDVLLWTGALYLLARLIRTEAPRIWLALGLILGLALLNKTGGFYFGLGLLVGMAATPQRRWLRTRWPWLAGAIALILFSPYLAWNLSHDFAHLEFIRNATSEKYAGLSALTFLAGQLLIHNPVTVPLWLAGLVFFFTLGSGRPFRWLGYVWAVGAVVLALNQHSKPEYMAPVHGALFAGGAVALERLLTGSRLRMLRPVLVAWLALGLVLVPAVVPILPVETYIAYAGALGIRPSTAEGKQLDRLPQFYADMFGWEEMVETVAGVYRRLPAREQMRCGIYAQNYGEAGAVDFLGARFGLPKAVSGHNSYWHWGQGKELPETLIVIGGAAEDHLQAYAEVEVAAVVRSDYAMPYENNLPIFVCRRPKLSAAQVWPRVKHFE